MRLSIAVPITISIAVLAPRTAIASDDACRAALRSRIEACASACIDRAKAAVDPEVRGRILGIGCTTNCTKLEMFNGNTCPR